MFLAGSPYRIVDDEKNLFAELEFGIALFRRVSMSLLWKERPSGVDNTKAGVAEVLFPPLLTATLRLCASL